VQGAQHYYFDAARWQKASAPLANEFVHLSFCTSKDAARCREEVLKLDAWLDKQGISTAEHRLPEMFDRQAAAEKRTDWRG
jgi:hypothetical protein